MNNDVKTAIVFTLGATIGSVVTWLIINEKYKQIADEEISSVKELYKKDSQEISEDADKEEENEVMNKYEKILDSTVYRNYSKKESKEEEDLNKPYVIEPGEFDENDYDTVTLFYFEDDVVTDEQHNIIDNIDELIGDDALNHFGEYEDDSVFVRNDVTKTDYEILKDGRNFSDILG